MPDVNCDMGEEMPNDALIMPWISSANIACGAHAGNEASMRATIALARAHGVAIGAHPSFADRANFGRVHVALSEREVYVLVHAQIALLSEYAQASGARLHHVKPHGALYNWAAVHRPAAQAIVQAMADFDPTMLLYGMGEMLAAAKTAGIPTKSEAFADRRYEPNGTLTPRSQPNSMIESEAEVEKQLLQMVLQGTVSTSAGISIPIQADTICIHGDGPNAVAYSKLIYRSLGAHNLTVATS